MKKVILAVFLSMFFTIGYAQVEKYTIQGHISGIYNASNVYLIEEAFINGPQTVVDSAKVTNGKFKFEGQVPAEVKMYFIKSADSTSRTALTPIFLENGNIRVQISAEHFTHRAKVRGTINNDLMTLYSMQHQHVMDSISIATDIDWAINGHAPEREQIEFPRRTKVIKDSWLNIQRNMVKTYNNTIFSPFLIYWDMRRDVTPDELKGLLDQLDPSLANHSYTKAIKDYAISTEFGVGNMMPDFKLPDMEGKDVEWKNFQNKYVLIDFWASWCAPCLREMPNVVKLYEECKDSNFEIVGVSLDKDKDKWIKAVKDNNMTWPQLSDLKAWDSELAKLCKVDAVPFTILVNPKGEVIAINLRGEELVAKVKELIKN